jgi:hypothetical protein
MARLGPPAMSAFAPLLGDKQTPNAPNPSVAIYEYTTWWPRSKSGRGPPPPGSGITGTRNFHVDHVDAGRRFALPEFFM